MYHMYCQFHLKLTKKLIKIIITFIVLIFSFTTEAQASVVKVVESLLLHGDYQKANDVLKLKKRHLFVSEHNLY